MKLCINIEEQYFQPTNLKKFKTIYKSSFKVSSDKPVIGYKNVYFLDGDIPKGFNYNDLGLFSTANLYKICGNSFIKPLFLKQSTITFSSLFLTKDCKLYIYFDDENRKDICNYGDKRFERQFTNLGSCYDSLRVYYDHLTKDVAVYNYQRSNKIIVFNLYEAYYQKKNDIFREISNQYSVIQSMIYARSNEESILIVIDNFGIKFYNLRGKYSWIKDTFVKGRLIESYDYGYSGMADFISNGNKLLYICSNYLFVFDLQNLEIIKKYYFESEDKIQCILGLKDGNALIGTNSGYIYLIGYTNGELKTLDYKKICDNSVLNLSYNEICDKGKKSCYIFVANCGYLHVFDIVSGSESGSGNGSGNGSGSEQNNWDNNYSYSQLLAIRYLFLLRILLIIFL